MSPNGAYDRQEHPHRSPNAEPAESTTPRGQDTIFLGRLYDEMNEASATVQITIDYDALRQWALGALRNRSGEVRLQGKMLRARAFDLEQHESEPGFDLDT